MDSRDGFHQAPQQGKILRAPSLKRGRPEERITDRIKLEKVLGVTTSSNAALTSDPNSEIVAYPAGCTVVLLSTKTAQQTHIINSSRKTVTSLAFSSCGRYLVTGECGHQPAVRVWDLQAESQPSPGGVPPQVPQVAEFVAHKYGVNCVAFSPSNKYVVSIGSQHDMIVNVWDWKNNIKVASNKVSTKVKAVAFAENGSYFVTVGNRHVKFWYLEYGRAKYKEAVPLMGRSAILGEQRNNYFCDVACGKSQCGDSTYAITRSGLLCEFNNRRLLDKWVELRTTSANCMAVGDQYIFVGCADGIVRCFDPSTLHFVTTLPRTHYLGVDVCQGLNISHMSTHPPNAKYPDAIAVTYDEINHKLTVVYNDHSLYVWAVRDIKRVGKSHSFLYHSACIWGVEMTPRESPLPPSSFMTCSSDDTIRVWSLDRPQESQARGMYQKNIYSNELLKVVYVDQELTYLKDLDLSASAAGNDKTESSYDSRNGVRSIRLSPDGKHLASGDRAGNIRIHETQQMKEICKVEAHDAEVLCLEYTSAETDHKLLASASRDRLIHVFDVNQGYNFLQTLDDHSSSITAVRFLNGQGNLSMVSCGADKSIIFRQLTGSPQGAPQFARGHNAAGKATLYDMEVDTGQKHVLTACQDRNVRVYSAQSGKHTKTFKGSTGDDGSLIKVVLDRSGIYVATSCTDKTLSVYDYYSGECMATMCGHSELATGLRFTNDCRRLISASGDGCIFVWKIPHDMVVTMQARLSQQAMRQGKTLDNEIFSDGASIDFYDPNANAVDVDYRFNVSALPLWAKKQITDDTSPPVSLNRVVDFPKGRWAQRAGTTIGVKSVYTDSVIPFPSIPDRRADSDGSKDSSIDSGTESRTESRTYSETRTETMSMSKVTTEFTVCPESYIELMSPTSQTSASNITLNRGDHRRTLLTDDSALGSLRDQDLESTAHDGDIEDISDQENRHVQPLYYPTQQDSASGSEFPVNAMDVDELRRSIKKVKRPNLPLVSVTTTSVSGSQDSDDDDDEASTPSGENTDRNPMSMFSVSSESLDQLVNREKYLQSTFESLSGNELETSIGKTSISSQHHTRNSGGPMQLRNVAVINAAKQIKADPEATKKREELNKRIEETRRKLQSVGYRSSLKSSQSITDLSNVPEKDNWHTPNRLQSQGISHHTPPYPTTVTTVPNHSSITYPRNFNQFPLQQTSAATSTNNSSYDYLSSIASASNYLTNINNHCGYGFANTNSQQLPLPNSSSLPSNLQLCGCYLKDIARNTSVNVPFGSAYGVPDNVGSVSNRNLTVPSTYTIGDTSSLKIERPRRLKIPEKSSSKFKLHKSLPVSPVSEECRFSDFAQLNQPSATIKPEPRRSFSYFVDLNSKLSTEEGLRQVCSDIQKFSQEFSALSPESKDVSLPGVTGKDDDEDGNFSSDSLEECSFTSTRNKKSKKYSPPRRCYSNNEIYNQTTSYEESFVHDPIPKSNTSFYLNQSNRNSRESILSDDYQNDDYNRAKSYCNSLESVLSDDSECKSAPLEVLFVAHRKKKLDPNTGIPYSNSSPIHIASTSQSQYTYDSLPKDYLDNYYTKQNPPETNQMPQMYNSPEYTSVASKPSVEPSKHEVSRSQSLGNDVLKTTTYSLNENIENQSPTFKIKKSNTSYEFQQKLLKFETGLSGNDTKPLSTSKHMRENNKKGIAYFIETPKSDKIENKPKSSGNGMSMDIPTLKSKNLQYKSKYCNVLNNKPEVKPETLFGDNSGVPTSSAQTQISTVFQSKENVMKSNTLDSNKLENKRQQRHLETTSLDRHLLSRTLFEAEKIAHKPPKAVRRNSSKSYSKNRTRKLQNNFSENKSCKTPVNFDRNVTKLSTKSDNSSNTSDSDLPDSIENVIELNYKEKNKEIDCEASNKAILSDIYDSLDKLILDTKIEQDSLENLTQVDKQNKEDKYNFWSKSKSVLEAEQKNVWKKYDDFDKINTEKSQANLRKPSNSNSNLLNISSSDLDKIQNSIENIKLLHEIQQKVHKINMLVDTFKENMTQGKVKVLSKMYETLSWSQTGLNNLTELSVHATKYKRRNLSLPNFVERNLSTFSTKPTQSTHVCRAQQSNHELRLSKSTNEMSNVLKLAMYNPDLALDPQPKHIPETSKLLADDAGRREPKIGGTVSHNSRASGSKTKAFQILPSKCEVHLSPETENSLRRACSLSDLSVPGAQKQKIQVSGKINKPSVPARTNIRTVKASSMTRSSSTGVLNQSDSDQDSTPKATNRNTLMRPTISSQNKVSNTKTNIVRRRIQQSMSTINLSTVGQEDSSSEETTPPNTSGFKPTVPPRPRSMTVDHNSQPIVVPRRHMVAQKDKIKANRHSSALEVSNKENDVNAKTAQISSQLCKDIAEQLTKAADNVVELYKRLTNISDSSNEGFASSAQKTSMVKILETSVAKTQSVLQEVAAQHLKQNGSSSSPNNNGNITDTQTDTVKKLNDLAQTNIGGGGGDQTNVISFMHQYSDILLNIMQQKMANANK